MNRRKFFAGLALVPALSVAAATAATEPGVFLPDDVPVVGRDEFSRLLADARRDYPNGTRTHRFLDGVVGPDNWLRRYGVADMFSVNGRVVAIRRTPTPYLSEGEARDAVMRGTLSEEAFHGVYLRA